MAEERWNDSRNLWGDDRRRERERARMRDAEDYGQSDYGYRGQRRAAEGADDAGYRPFGDTGPVYTRSGGYTGEGRPYGASGRYEDISPAYRDFDAAQRRRHGGEWDRDAYVPNPREGRGEELRSWWDRTEDAVSAMFGDEHARRRREWDHRKHEVEAEMHGEHKGRGPKGYRRSDARMAEDINDRLTDDPLIDASHIEVSVKDGEATLAGMIYRREDKRRAEDIADRVSGISHVQNNLRLRPYDADTALTDAGVPLI